MTPELQSALTALLSRKFLVTMTCIILGTFFLEVSPEQKLTFYEWAIGLFGAANIAGKFANPSKVTVTEKSQTTPDSTTTEKTVEKPIAEPQPNG